jgi:hypothetical protein
MMDFEMEDEQEFMLEEDWKGELKNGSENIKKGSNWKII